MDIKPKINWEDDESHSDGEQKGASKKKEHILDEWTKSGPPPLKVDPQPESKTQNKRPKKPSARAFDYVIDLHGKTLDEAQDFVESEIKSMLPPTPRGPIKIRIITGKGHHNKGTASVLATDIQPFVRQMFRERIISIQESPSEVKSKGLPFRGHFDVTMK